MSRVVSLAGYRPSPRFDEEPWTQARIEESLSTTEGPWGEAETIDLDPLDEDPAHPALRSFTTEEVSDEALWLRIVFVDEDGDEQQPTLPVSADPLPWRPTVDEVAALLRARTKDSNSKEVGTFDEDTRPTAEQVERLITGSVDDILAVFPSGAVPEDSYATARRAAALKTALMIELSYFPEQALESSPYLQLRTEADQGMRTLIAAAQLADLFAETA